MMNKGLIYDIKRFAIHDGPGIRTTVFLKGCSCDCWWCHNPESKSEDILMVEKSVPFHGKDIIRNEIVGENMSLDKLVQEIESDQVFYSHSDGGVTFSGGEPMQQKIFLMQILRACKRRGIHTTLDTTAFFSREALLDVYDDVDLFMVDLKFLNRELHKKYVGVDNAVILDNITYLLNSDKKVWVRIPVVPGVNSDDIDQMISFLKSNKAPEQVNLLPYHRIGMHKYIKFGLECRMPEVDEPDEVYMLNIKERFENQGFKTIIGG